MTTKEAFANAVKARINGNKQHGWGVEDSYAAILAVVAAETGSEVKDLDTPEFGHIIKAVINPSQFRQSLESNGVLDKSEGKKQNATLKGLMDSLK